MASSARVKKTQVPEILFRLPDDSCLKFARPYATGKQVDWFMTNRNPGVYASSLKPKGKHYKVDLWSSRTNFVLVAADIDSLPVTHDSYDSLFQDLQRRFIVGTAITARSASGKVKVFFLVQLPHGVAMTNAIAGATLNYLFSFNPQVAKCLDKGTGTRITYLNHDVLVSLSQGLPHLSAIPAVLPKGLKLLGRGSGVISSITPATNQTRPYRIYADNIEKVIPGVKFKGARDGLLRILLEAPQLLGKQGFGISTKKAAKDLGVSQPRLSKLRKHFEKIGWLIAVDDRSYVPGNVAIRFKAAGELELALRKRFSFNNIDIVVPTSIPDGQWNKELGKLVGILQPSHTLDEVTAKIAAIKGAADGSRLKQASQWYSWWQAQRAKGAA